MNTIEPALETILSREIGGFVSLQHCERLSGGANQETYRLVIETAAGDMPLCLRRAAGGVVSEQAPGQPGLEVEAALFRAAANAGVPEPDVHYVLQPSDDLGPGFVMQWLDGETLGARIARGDAFADIRGKLAYQCGELLARIHAIDVDQGGLRSKLEQRDTGDVIRLAWDRYQTFDTPQPMIDYTARWLLDNLPEHSDLRLVHGDFRNGNLMVTPQDGIVGVLDWEGAHVGDPMRDLGWLCTNSWRFGNTQQTVGGFGNLDDLFAGYSAISGKAVDAQRVAFWIVYGSFSWAIGCLTMAEHYRTGPDATVERPAIGRRSSECQIDCANLLIPGTVALPEVGAATRDKSMPRNDELLTSVRDFLRGDVMASTTGRTQFLARVAANSLDILQRDSEYGSAYRTRETALLEDLLETRGDYVTLKELLCRRLRAGNVRLTDAALQDYLRFATLTQALIDQPQYSGVRTALAAADEEDRPG